MIPGHGGVAVSSDGGEALANEMGVLFLGKIPLDPGVVSNGDAGSPLTDHADNSGSAQAFRQLVQTVLDRTRAERVQLKVLQ